MVDDIEALFGSGLLIPKSEPKHEIKLRKDPSEYTHEDLKHRFIEETEDLLKKSNDAVTAALEQATMAPGEGESVSAIASLLNAHSRLLENLNKLYVLEEKHRHAKELAEARMKNESKMNTENNMAKLIVSRETIMAEIMKKTESDKDRILDMKAQSL